jgi:radical SAM superfamily enzyme YgiQ (UPF0313 family)
MKLVLIAPASGKWRKVAKSGIFNGRTFRFSLLSLLRVAAETPPDVTVEIVDEQVREIPWHCDADLVGITCMTALAPRAYEIAARFRQRGIPVVLGGMHPTLCPQEAAAHATAIVTGEAEGVWPRLIAHAREGRLCGIYNNSAPPPLEALPPVPHHLLDPQRYAALYATQATRGCSHGCDFCAVSAFSGRTHRRRPVGDVVAELGSTPHRFVLFVDDNLTADREYARRLFHRLAPLKKRWVTQSTLSIADDPELVHLMANAGCIGLFVGMETFSDANLEAVGKSCNRTAKYRAAIDLLHDCGIAVEAGVVFGFDGDGPAVFETTLQHLDDLGVDAVQVSIFTPLPGTPAFGRMETRLLHTNWAEYDFHHAVFQPRQMSAAELKAGHDWVTRRFYSLPRITRRLWRHLLRPGGPASLPYVLAVNLAYYGRVRRWRIGGWNPAAKRAFPGNPHRLTFPPFRLQKHGVPTGAVENPSVFFSMAGESLGWKRHGRWGIDKTPERTRGLPVSGWAPPTT